MGIVDRPVDDEPDEKPDQLGRHLLRIQRDHPGEWREAFESHNRSHAVRIEGCLTGRGAGRIAGVTDITGWQARLVERTEGDDVLHVVRVRYTPPKPAKHEPEAGRLDASQRIDRDAAVGAVPLVDSPRPADPETLAESGLDKK